jgi:hypothetical protein
MSQLSNWAPYDSYVQGGMVDGRFMSAAFTLIAAGPPRLASVGGAAAVGGPKEFAFPIGVVQNFNLSHNRQFSRFWEVGSERSYFISGRTMGQMSLSRIMYHGSSLLRVLYAYYQDEIPATGAKFMSLFDNEGMNNVANPHDVVIPPGYENVFLNLASDLFAQPIGLLLYFRDSNLATLGAGYLESCYVPAMNLASDSQGTVIQESAQLQFERMMPIDVNAVALIRSGFTGFAEGGMLASGSTPSGEGDLNSGGGASAGTV